MSTSAKERTFTITFLAAMLALAVIFGFFKIPVTSFLEIRFLFLPISIAGAVTGPIGGLAVGAASDLVSYLIKPTGAFFPGFTISYALTGLIAGLICFKKHSLPRIIISQTIITIFINMLMNTYWLSILYGMPFMAIVGPRLIKEAVSLPINIFLFWIALREVDRLVKYSGLMPSYYGTKNSSGNAGKSDPD
ncbi:MAG: folate family ECF transporter S component [Lachnospiraceae bacterium]|jgi:ECF transporter S component (folate family)|nr:folate family ECF transporter S component [Lachnospiraceae bacterium]MEE3462005.1 folate family ECF transporter S component [Lachnospiraceae bacterium]